MPLGNWQSDLVLSEHGAEFIFEALDGEWSTAFEILNLPFSTLSDVIRSLGTSLAKEREYLEAMASGDEVRRLFASQQLFVEIFIQQQRILEEEIQRKITYSKEIFIQQQRILDEVQRKITPTTSQVNETPTDHRTHLIPPASQQLFVEVFTQQQRILEEEVQRKITRTTSQVNEMLTDHRTHLILEQLEELRRQVLERISRAMEVIRGCS